MKICFLTDDPSQIGGGPEHIRQVTKILEEKYKYSVDVITPLTMDPKFDFHNFRHRIKFAFWVFKFLLTSNYDLYHSHTFSTAAFLPVIKLRGKKEGITVHGAGTNLIGGGILNKIGVPKLLSNLILNYWPFDFRLSASALPGFVTVGNGVDINEFSKIKRTPHKVFTILCISRRDPVKGIDILEKVVKEIPNIKLNLISDRQRTMADFAEADCYVLPSLSEGLPIVLLEAMTAKLPIVATDTGDCRAIIEKADCGLIVEPGSAAELSKAIVQMIDDKNRAKMGERGYDYVKENYTWEKVATLYNSAYRRLDSFL